VGNANLSGTKEWSRAVVARDGKCCDCGATGTVNGGVIEGLHAMRLDRGGPMTLANGVTVCELCRLARYGKRAKVRLRSEDPQKRTLWKRIRELEAEVKRLRGDRQKRRGDRFPNPWPAE